MIIVPDVELILNTFKSLLENVVCQPAGQVKTVTRTWVPWDQIADIAQPAIIITDPTDEQTDRRGQQFSLKLNLRLICYVRVDRADKDYPPSTRINNLIQGVRTAMLPRIGKDVARNALTLNGLVSNCFIDGKILKDAGVIDSQGSVLIPVTVLIS